MGWSGGTEIFDCVAEELLTLKYQCYDVDLPMYRIMNLLSALQGKLVERDWDTQQESNYYDHLQIGDVLGNTFEEEDDE